MVSIERSTVAGVGEPTFTRNGVCTNDGTPRSARPATNAASCAGSPADRFQPRRLPTKTCTACAPTSSVWRSPPVARPPATWTCAPTGMEGALTRS